MCLVWNLNMSIGLSGPRVGAPELPIAHCCMNFRPRSNEQTHFTHSKIGMRGFPARGYFIPGREGGGWWPGKVPCRRRGCRATGPGPGHADARRIHTDAYGCPSDPYGCILTLENPTQQKSAVQHLMQQSIQIEPCVLKIAVQQDSCRARRR